MNWAPGATPLFGYCSDHLLSITAEGSPGLYKQGERPTECIMVHHDDAGKRTRLRKA
jgi:hypothetical protein